MKQIAAVVIAPLNVIKGDDDGTFCGERQYELRDTLKQPPSISRIRGS